MEKFIITTENTCDLSFEELKKLNVRIINLHYFLNGIECQNENYDEKEFYGKIRKGALGSTSQPNRYEFETFFRSFLDEGYDILHLSFSSVLSGTYDNACSVATFLEKDYPQRRIKVIDTKSQSAGQGLLVTLVAQYKDNGNSFCQCAEYAESLIQNINHVFTIQDLRTLARTGRASNAEAFIGNILQIKPLLYTNKDGYLTPSMKLFSRKLALKTMVEKVKKKYNGLSNLIYIAHSDCLIEAENVAFALSQIEGVEVKIFSLCPVIGCHTGADTISVFFTANERKGLL